MGKVVKAIAGIAIVAAGFIVPGAQFLLPAGLGLIGSSFKKKPKASQADRDRLTASINPRAPRAMVFGRTAMATDIRDQEFTGSNQEYLHRFIVVASHKANSIQEIWFDDKLAWTSAGGVQSGFTGYLDVATRLEGGAANAINISARMGSTRRYTGLAYVHLRYKLTGNSKKTESPFASSVPTRITIIGEGIPCYDPRQDSTVAGGSGAHRADDQATWTYGAHARNPVCQSATYLLGWRINGILAVGKGIPKRRFDFTTFITAANVCDETIALAGGGTEPRYRSDGVFSEGDDMSLVLGQFAGTMDAVFYDPQGRIAVKCMVNDLASPVASFTADDVLGDVNWQPFADTTENYNLIRGTFTDPSTNSLYQSIDYPEIYEASVDGIDRPLTLDFPLVQSASQAQRLAKRALMRAKYGGGTLSCEMQATAWRAEQYAPIELTFPPLGMIDKIFRVQEIETRVDGTVPIVLSVEDARIYDWDAEDVAPVDPIASTPYDPANNPFAIGALDGDALHTVTPSSRVFTANFAGALDSEQLPATFIVKRYRAGVDVSTSSTWTIDAQTGISGVTVTVTDGAVTIPTGASIAINSSIRVKSVRDGIDLFSTIPITRSDAVASSTGGSGGTTVFDSTLGPVSTTTLTAVTDLLTVKTGSAGTITFSGALDINAAAAAPDGTFGAVMRWRYRPVGGSFTDVGAGDIASTADAVVEIEGGYVAYPGYIDAAASVTGLSANTDYEVELRAARDTSSPAKSISFGGTVYAVGS